MLVIVLSSKIYKARLTTISFCYRLLDLYLTESEIILLRWRVVASKHQTVGQSIHSKDLNQHCERLAEVLSRFRQHNLRVKISKCTFAAPKVSYLGHVISAEGISPDPTKVEAVQNLLSPKSVKDVRSFLGLAGYYRRFVRGFATVGAPLTDLTKQDRRFDWTTEQLNYFIYLLFISVFFNETHFQKTIYLLASVLS